MHCMGLIELPGAPVLAEDINLQVYDTESWTADHSKLTEVGWGTVDCRSMRQITDWSNHGEKLLRHVKWNHERIAPNAHLINTRYKCKGDPKSNRFGHTMFCTKAQALEAINKDFLQPIDKSKPKRLKAVVILGHDLGGDLDLLGKVLGFKGGEMGIIVAKIDTQKMAWELEYQKSRNKIGLEKLTTDLGMMYRDPHTALNDAAMTMIAALLMVLQRRVKEQATKTVKQVVDEIEAHSRLQEVPKIGSLLYCFKCGDYEHPKDDCPRRDIRCPHCDRAGKPGRVVCSHILSSCVAYQRWIVDHPGSPLIEETKHEGQFGV